MFTSNIKVNNANYIVEMEVFGNPLRTFNVTLNNIEGITNSQILKDIGDLIQVRRIIRKPHKKIFKSIIRMG